MCCVRACQQDEAGTQSAWWRPRRYRGRAGHVPAEVRDLPCLRRQWQNGDWRGRVSTATCPRFARRVPDGRRNLLPHTQRHPEHRHAGLEHARGADLAIGSLYPQSADHRPDVATDLCNGVPIHGVFSLVQPAMAAQTGPALDWHYVGSTECKSCHAGIYERWKKTPMANVVRDPREHPDAIIPDLSKPDRCSPSPRTTSPSSTAASGNNATSRRSATIISRSQRSGT